MGRLQRKKNSAKAKKKNNKNLTTTSVGDAVLMSTKKASVTSKENRQYMAVNKTVAVKRSDNFFSSAFAFFRESKLELKKVVWPSRKQTVGSTFVVIAVVSLISIFLGIIDAGLSGVIRAVLR